MKTFENLIVSDDWLDNIEEYRAVEYFVIQKFSDVLNELGYDIQNWDIPFFNNKYFGDREIDANPIFSARNREQNYIIRAIMYDGYQVVDFWSDTFDDIPLYTIAFNWRYFNELEPFFRKTLQRLS